MFWNIVVVLQYSVEKKLAVPEERLHGIVLENLMVPQLGIKLLAPHEA
jgi:hypothetical protein